MVSLQKGLIFKDELITYLLVIWNLFIFIDRTWFLTLKKFILALQEDYLIGFDCKFLT